MASLLSVALSGLNAAQAGMATTSHNITNANVDGFSRQQIVQVTQEPMYTGAGYFGQGTRIDSVKRSYSQFLENQVLSASSAKAQFETYSNYINQIDSLLGTENTGVSPALQGFFAALDQVSAAPTNLSARQGLLSSAQTLVSNFQAVSDRMDEVRAGVEGHIAVSASNVTDYARQIAELNGKITLAQAGGTNTPPNDLLDARDQVVAQLNQEIKVTTQTQADGSLNVFIGTGQMLVMGLESFAVSVVPSADDPSSGMLAISVPGGAKIRLPEGTITGGNLAGLLTFRSQALTPAENALGRIAAGVASTFNAQHQLGQDLGGQLGGNFFTPLVPTVQGLPGAGGVAPTATLSGKISDPSALTIDDYLLSFDGTSYSVTNLTSGSVTSGLTLPISVGGVSIDLAVGSVGAGDRFLVQPTRYAARDIGVAITDPREIAAAMPSLITATNANQGSASITLGGLNSLAGVDTDADRIADFPPITLAFDAAANQFNVSQTVGGITYTTTINYVPATDAAGRTLNLRDFAPVGSQIPDLSVKLSGVPADGDFFQIATNPGGVADSRNALVLGNLQQTKTLAGGGVSYQGAYAQLVSDIGGKANSAMVSAQAQESALTLATASQQSLSGVNLDEEAANLIRYQQAYQASARVMNTANKLFDEILSIMR